jgi:hypothetical protein
VNVSGFDGQVGGEDVCGREAALAEGTDTECVVALGEATALVVDGQMAVEPGRVGEAECAVEQDLAGGRFEEVGAAHDFCDGHRCVVGYAGELIAGDTNTPRTKTCPRGPRFAVTAPDDEVAEVHAGDEALRAEIEVVELDGFAVGDAEAPIATFWLHVIRCGLHLDLGGAAGAGIDGLVVERILSGVCTFMRGTERDGEILARAATGIEEAALHQAAPCGEIDWIALTLCVRSVWAADVRAFVPVNAEPAKVFEGSVGVLGAAAIGIEVFHAHDECAVCGVGVLEGCKEGARVAEVQVAGGRGRESSAIGWGRRWGEAGHADNSVDSGDGAGGEYG